MNILVAISGLQHFAKLDTQRVSKALHVVDGYISLPSLHRSHVRAMQFRQLREALLRELTLES
jgi:hypothetical protein